MSDEKNVTGCAVAILGIMFVTPIWYFLLYQILVAVNASTPMWVAYWAYVPLGFLTSILGAVFKEMK